MLLHDPLGVHPSEELDLVPQGSRVAYHQRSPPARQRQQDIFAERLKFWLGIALQQTVPEPASGRPRQRCDRNMLADCRGAHDQGARGSLIATIPTP